jgi:hypothetical protein
LKKEGFGAILKTVPDPSRPGLSRETAADPDLLSYFALDEGRSADSEKRREEVEDMYETIILAIACLSAPLFAKYAGYEIHKKPFDMVGVAGLFFLLGAAFSLGPSKVEFMQKVALTGSIVSHILGWLLVIIGAFRSTLDVLMEKEEDVVVKKQADLL